MMWYKFLTWSIIYGLLMLTGNLAKTVKKRGVMDNLNDGLKAAGQMFGINTAADVANLVAKAFSTNNGNSIRNKPDLFSFLQNNIRPSLQGNKEHSTNSEERHNENEHDEPAKQFQTKTSGASPSKDEVGVNFGTSNLIYSMLRLVGFDAAKLGALAINALILISTAIGNTLMGTTTHQTQSASKFKNGEEENVETGPEEKYSPNDHQPRDVHDVTTIEWFLQNSSGKMKRILNEATKADLADKLTDMITNHETIPGQASCVKMLVCKSSPFIWGMQKSIRKYINPKEHEKAANSEENDSSKRLFNVQSFFTHLPSFKEYREYSEKCEKIYSPHCNTTDVFDKKY